MTNNYQSQVLSGLANLAGEMNPMKSFTFLSALGITALAAWVWLESKDHTAKANAGT